MSTLSYDMGRKSTKPAVTEFGRWLRGERTAKGLTMTVLAERADTGDPVISLLERGLRNPSRDMVKRIASALTKDADQKVVNSTIDAGLIAAGFSPEFGAYSVIQKTANPSVELVPLTPEERAIIEQIRAMAGNKPEQESRRERIARDEADDDSRQAIEERYRSTREADIFDR